MVTVAVQVVAGINQKLQELVVQAQQLAASGDSSDTSALLQLHVSISKLAAVQQQDVVTSIANMASQLATVPGYNPSTDLQRFSNVSDLAEVRTTFPKSFYPQRQLMHRQDFGPESGKGAPAFSATWMLLLFAVAGFHWTSTAGARRLKGG
jgi:hypothetical protein